MLKKKFCLIFKENNENRIRVSGIQDPGSGIRDPRSGIRDPGSEIRDPRSGIRDPGSGKDLFQIPDPDTGAKKAQDPGSATLSLYVSEKVKSFIPELEVGCVEAG